MNKLRTNVSFSPLDQWEEFFEKFRKFGDVGEKPFQLDRWQNFFDEFRKFPFEDELPSQEIKLDEKRVGEFFTDFKKYHDCFYNSFIESGGTIDVWKIAKLKHDEVRNCAVLGWLLDPHGSHGQGVFFFRAFLSCLETNPITFDGLSNEYKVILEQSHASNCNLDENTPSNESVKPVSTDKGKKTNRVDFVIENNDFLLFVEAKIYAQEGDQQLRRYSELLKDLAVTRESALVFLTTTGYIPKDLDNLSTQLIPITWRKIALSFEKAMKMHIEEKLGKGLYGTLDQPLWAAVTQQFCHHIKQF